MKRGFTKKLSHQDIFFLIVLFFLPFFLILYFVYADNVFGTINLVILSSSDGIVIDSPQNQTYNFTKNEPYIISVNVSSPLPKNSWWYDVDDLRHNTTVLHTVYFTPNTTAYVSRWSNKFTVYANDSSGIITSANVIFFVSVPNSAPVLLNQSNAVLVCEDNSLYYPFEALDVDEDTLAFSVTPTNPIFVARNQINPNATLSEYYLFSGLLGKSAKGLHRETVSVSDGEYSDSKEVNVTVIEINHPPAMTAIGTQTVNVGNTSGNFYLLVDVQDQESGGSGSGNISFYINFVSDPTPLFNLSLYGVINSTLNTSMVGLHEIQVCATDQSLAYIHPNISLCGQDGGSTTVCRYFNLSVVSVNNPPTIIEYVPQNLSLQVDGNTEINFSVLGYDPDVTTLNYRWYADHILVHTAVAVGGSNNFSYTFPCGISGNHTMDVVVDDGLANDSITWTLMVRKIDCPITLGSEGRSQRPFCTSQWACVDWDVCQNAQKSLEGGVVHGTIFRSIKDACTTQRIYTDTCGFQLRTCTDIHTCNNTQEKPQETQACVYVKSPGCSDGISNCHDGGCEVLVDCGGPCHTCPSCSDGLQNQGELGIDCEGPCPWTCVSIQSIDRIQILAYLTFIVLIIAIIIKMVQIFKIRAILRGVHHAA